jgi:hypothetical protein
MKRVITILAVILIIAALPVVVWFVQQQGQKQDIRSNAAPATTLYFNSSALSKQQGDTFSLDVTVDTGTNSISAADLIINTDPTKIKITGITPGTFLPNEIVAGAHTDSKATIVRGSPGTSPGHGIGVLATVTFQVVADTGTSQITFTGSRVTATGETGNVLAGTTPTTVTIGGSSGTTVTVTTTPIASPTRTPTATPTGDSTEPTSTSTPTPTQASGSGSGGNTTTLTLTSPASGATVDTDLPTLSGVAPAGSTVSITIYSDPITATVTTDSDGRWSYTVTQVLSEGSHNVVITAVSSDGTTQTLSRTFYVQTGAMPVTGASVMTWVLPVTVAASFILFGLAL